MDGKVIMVLVGYKERVFTFSLYFTVSMLMLYLWEC